MTLTRRKSSRSEHEERREKSKRDPIKDSDLINLSKTKVKGQKRKLVVENAVMLIVTVKEKKRGERYRLALLQLISLWLTFKVKNNQIRLLMRGKVGKSNVL